ncbi:PREDICTED: uncharacterized protein LOC106804722 isoform X2 [Priapulus caudatus]|uniref:Uncharacterized protein LOC106804722 isoform X2 n=1 Tax=Priapulus caudatus TaxID=37621 RepID=A0ABM1DNI8_PRICU|nr:PREDICTED: uncharacterized protein LOC106804722 isoform X2 [Priapulus caudatus]
MSFLEETEMSLHTIAQLVEQIAVEIDKLHVLEEAEKQHVLSYTECRNFVSVMKLYGKPLPTPLLSVERRDEMIQYRTQAQLVEARLKTKKSRKLVDRVQSMLDKIVEKHTPVSSPRLSEEEQSGSATDSTTPKSDISLGTRRVVTSSHSCTGSNSDNISELSITAAHVNTSDSKSTHSEVMSTPQVDMATKRTDETHPTLIHDNPIPITLGNKSRMLLEKGAEDCKDGDYSGRGSVPPLMRVSSPLQTRAEPSVFIQQKRSSVRVGELQLCGNVSSVPEKCPSDSRNADFHVISQEEEVDGVDEKDENTLHDVSEMSHGDVACTPTLAMSEFCTTSPLVHAAAEVPSDAEESRCVSTLCPSGSISLGLDMSVSLSSMHTLKDVATLPDDLNVNDLEWGTNVSASTHASTIAVDSTETSIAECSVTGQQISRAEGQCDPKVNANATPGFKRSHIRRGSYTLDAPSPGLLKAYNLDCSKSEESNSDAQVLKMMNKPPCHNWQTEEIGMELSRKAEHLRKRQDQSSPIQPQVPLVYPTQVLEHSNTQPTNVFTGTFFDDIKPLFNNHTTNYVWGQQQEAIKENTPPLATWSILSAQQQKPKIAVLEDKSGWEEFTSKERLTWQQVAMTCPPSTFGFSSGTFDWSVDKQFPKKNAVSPNETDPATMDLEKHGTEFDEKRKEVFQRQSLQLAPLFLQRKEQEKQQHHGLQVRNIKTPEKSPRAVGRDRCESAPPYVRGQHYEDVAKHCESTAAFEPGALSSADYGGTPLDGDATADDELYDSMNDSKSELERSRNVTVRSQTASLHNSPLVMVESVGLPSARGENKYDDMTRSKDSYDSTASVCELERSRNVTVRSHIVSPHNSPFVTVRSSPSGQKVQSGQKRFFTSPTLQKTDLLPDKEIFPSSKFCRISALVKGYLTRRLLSTDRVKSIIKTIKDTVEFTVNFASDTTTQPPHAALQDLEFQQRLLSQLEAALFDLHDIFHTISTKEKMAIIARDRQLLREKLIKEKQSSGNITQRRLSAATIKAIARKAQCPPSVKPDIKPKKSSPRNQAVGVRKQKMSHFDCRPYSKTSSAKVHAVGSKRQKMSNLPSLPQPRTKLRAEACQTSRTSPTTSSSVSRNVADGMNAKSARRSLQMHTKATRHGTSRAKRSSEVYTLSKPLKKTQGMI